MTATSTSKPGLARVAPLYVSGTFDGYAIVTDPEPEALGEVVMGGQVVVVSGVFGSYVDELLALRRQVFDHRAQGGSRARPLPDRTVAVPAGPLLRRRRVSVRPNALATR